QGQHRDRRASRDGCARSGDHNTEVSRSGTVMRGLPYVFQNDRNPLLRNPGGYAIAFLSMAPVSGREAWEGARRARGQTWEPAAPARADATSPGATGRDMRWRPGRAEQPPRRVWVRRMPCTRAVVGAAGVPSSQDCDRIVEGETA